MTNKLYKYKFISKPSNYNYNINKNQTLIEIYGFSCPQKFIINCDCNANNVYFEMKILENSFYSISIGFCITGSSIITLLDD